MDNEWREWLGMRVLQAMTCTHEDDNFGPGAVCSTCWANTQAVCRVFERDLHEIGLTTQAPVPHTGTGREGEA